MFLKIILLEILFLNIKETKCNDDSQSCAKLLDNYSDTLKNFLTCSMHNAVPVSFCFNCTQIYYNLSKQYDTLIKAEIIEANHTVKCSEKYIDQDRLNIVLRNHDYFANLWSKAACSECFFDNTTTNSNETQAIIRKLEDLRQCITNFWDKDPCKNCVIFYNKANTFYNDVLIKKHKENICFDILDDMNRTRSLWSKTLKCCKREADFESFYAIATSITCLPVLYYILSYIYIKRFERNQIITQAQQVPNNQWSNEPSVSNIQGYGVEVIQSVNAEED